MSKKIQKYASPYSSIDQVPEHLRFSRLQEMYQDDDLWQEFLEDQYIEEGYSENFERSLRRTGCLWKEFCEAKNEHHGFASPVTVNEWLDELSETMSLQTVFSPYLSILNRFYYFLMLNIDYPHTYNPVEFSIQMYDLSETVWEKRHNHGGSR